MIAFDQSAYVADISEFSFDSVEGVVLSLDDYTLNLLRVYVPNTLVDGDTFTVFWRNQPIINVTVSDLSVISVNGSTALPLFIDAPSGQPVKLDVAFSHAEYEPKAADFVVEPASAGTMAKGSDGIWAFTPDVSAVGSSVNIFCIGQWIAKVSVLNSINVDPVEFNISTSSAVDISSDIVDVVGNYQDLVGTVLTVDYNGDVVSVVGEMKSTNQKVNWHIGTGMQGSRYYGYVTFGQDDGMRATLGGPPAGPYRVKLLSLEKDGVKYLFT